MLGRREAVAAIASSLLAPAVVNGAGPSTGEKYPSRPVRILVGFPPGASTDSIARIAADILSRRLNGPVVVVNQAGAGGNVAAQAARTSDPDGYTFLMAIASHVTNRALYKNLPYDPVRAFTPVSLIARIPFVLVAHRSFAANTIRESLEMAKRRPGELNYATSGLGSSQHLAMEQFADLTGAKLTHVAYRGGIPALTAVAANEVPLALLTTTTVMPMLQNGSIKAIAIASKQRSKLLPDLPTFRESGSPDFTADTWFGLLAPRGTPPAIVDRIHSELTAGLQAPAVLERFQSMDARLINAGPVDFGNVMRQDDVTWSQIVREAGIQLD